MYAVSLAVMGMGARGVGPAVARHTSFLVGAIAAAVFASVLFTATALALKLPNAWVRGVLMAGATAALFFAVYQIG